MSQLPLYTIPIWVALSFLVRTTAHTADDFPDESAYLSEPPVVLSASRLEQPRNEAPVTITVIDRAAIEASGARHIQDLFRLVPGYQVGHVRGHELVVGYHGLTGEFAKNMQVLVDGRSVYSLISFGGVDWFSIPYTLDDIERIEVIQGSNSAAYGANAFLGVANIITRRVADRPDAKLSWRAGNRDIKDGHLQLRATQGPLAMAVSAGTRGDDGLEVFQEDRSQARYLNSRLEWNASARDEITLQFGAERGRRGKGTTITFDNARTQKVDSAFAQLRWRRTLSSRSEISLQYYHNRDTIQEQQLFSVPGVGSATFDVDVVAHRDHAEIQHLFAIGPTVRLVWGGEARHDQARSQIFFNTDSPQTATLWRAFSSLEWRARPDTVVNLGGTLEDYSLTGTDWAPRVSLSHHLTPQHSLRYGYTSAFLTPTLGEAKGDSRLRANGVLYDITFLGNGDLEPARLKAHEIGYLGEFHSLGLTLNARLFHEKIKGLFSTTHVPSPEPELLDPLRRARTVDNLQDACVRGAEYQARFDMGAGRNLIFNHAYVEIETPVASKENTGNRFDRSAPQHALSALLDTPLPGGLRAGLGYYYTGDMHWVGLGARQPSQSHFDLRLARAFKLGKGEAQIDLVARNLLNQDYTEFRLENAIKPRYYATLSATF